MSLGLARGNAMQDVLTEESSDSFRLLHGYIPEGSKYKQRTLGFHRGKYFLGGPCKRVLALLPKAGFQGRRQGSTVRGGW